MILFFGLHTKLYKFISPKAWYNTIWNLITSKSVSVAAFQYTVCPLLSMTAWMRRGMLDTRDLLYSWVISGTQTSLIACIGFSALDSCSYATLSFMIVHRFSIGLRSGLFPGHSSREILFFFMTSVATFDSCHGTPSCMKIVQQWMCMCSFSFSLSNSTYLGPFIVVLGGMKYRPAVPWHKMAPQIIWLDRCLIVATTYFFAEMSWNSAGNYNKNLQHAILKITL